MHCNDLHALPETAYMPSARFFAECSVLCRVSNHGHSANKLFAECRAPGTRQSFCTRYIQFLPSSSTRQKSNTRHKIPVPSSAGQALGNICARGRRVRQPSNRLTAVIVCRVPVVRHSANPNLHRVFFLRHSAKFVLPSAFRWRSANI